MTHEEIIEKIRETLSEEFEVVVVDEKPQTVYNPWYAELGIRKDIAISIC